MPIMTQHHAHILITPTMSLPVMAIILTNLNMSMIQRLLSGVGEQEVRDYQSYTQLHLKQILTTINKHLLEDMTQSNIRKNRCIVGCYDYHIPEGRADHDDALLWERVQELRTCKEKCLSQSKEVEKFLDNINFYSKKKFGNCSAHCPKLPTEEERNTCLWECYNRLDRRYKKYWANQKQNIEAKFKI